MEQVRIDASRQVVTLAESRLGIGGPLMSVRQAARSLGLTSARVYQLLNEVNDIMMVRWPTGRHQTHELREKFEAEEAQAGPLNSGAVDLAQFYAAVELFYPGSRRGASGPLERTFEPAETDGDWSRRYIRKVAFRSAKERRVRATHHARRVVVRFTHPTISLFCKTLGSHEPLHCSPCLGRRSRRFAVA